MFPQTDTFEFDRLTHSLPREITCHIQEMQRRHLQQFDQITVRVEHVSSAAQSPVATWLES